jgi:hypothetical protein
MCEELKAKAVPIHVMKVCKGNRGIAPLILNLGTGRGEWSTSHLGRFAPGKNPGTHRTEGWVGLKASTFQPIR